MPGSIMTVKSKLFEFIRERFLKPSNANADMMGNPIHPATELALTICHNFVFAYQE